RRGLVGAVRLLDVEDPPELARLAGLDQRRQVLLAQPAAELDVELLRFQLDRLLDGAVDAAAERVAHLEQEVEETFMAPAVLDEGEHRVAVAVGEEALD